MPLTPDYYNKLIYDWERFGLNRNVMIIISSQSDALLNHDTQ